MRAIAATFQRRDTALQAKAPEALTATFANNPTKQRSSYLLECVNFG
ncbi:hypothetical protein [Roseateles saccharophilus]|nr:hypothetical protein [Roseateles saccharophilus]